MCDRERLAQTIAGEGVILLDLPGLGNRRRVQLGRHNRHRHEQWNSKI
jgi:hypothetical protein